MPAARPSRRAVLGLAGAAGAAGALSACSGGASAVSPSVGTVASAPPSPSPAASTAAVTAPGASTVPPSPPATSPPAGPDVTHGPTGTHAVALTFHGDGPESMVRHTLAVLRTAQAQVTVLAIGRWLAAQPDLARMIRDAGHELGNHTWSHQTMPRLGAGAVRSEIERAADELAKLTGDHGRWFRPSGTPHSTPLIRAAAVRAGYGACLGYDVDPLDYTDPGPQAIVRALARSVRPGSVVSLHLGHPGTLAALPAVLAHLHDRGLAPVTASRLLNG
jgi:peptidoglycan/xylan/chitin deacetylase (PgdA/CDA1 family)